MGIFISDAVAGLDFKCDGRARKRHHEDLHRSVTVGLRLIDGVAGSGIKSGGLKHAAGHATKCDGLARQRLHKDLSPATPLGLHVVGGGAGHDINVIVTPVSIHTRIRTAP